MEKQKQTLTEAAVHTMQPMSDAEGFYTKYTDPEFMCSRCLRF